MNHAIHSYQPSVFSAPRYQPEKGSVKVEPTKEDDLDGPGHNLGSGRADTDRAMRRCSHWSPSIEALRLSRSQTLPARVKENSVPPERKRDCVFIS